MSKQLNKILLWVTAVLAGLLLEHWRTEFAAWISTFWPTTALDVLIDYWPAALLTTGAAALAFCSAMFIGYAAGLTASVAELAATRRQERKHPKIATFISVFVSRLYYLLYLLPFVLTVSLMRGLTVKGPPSLQALSLIVVAGAALGGYQVFSSFYNAATVAPSANRFLVESLQPNEFCLAVFPRSWNRKLHLLGSAYRLRDCQIQSHYDAIERAWHLSIVAVMITESLIASFYESLWRSPGVVHEYMGGLGGIVMAPSGFLHTRTLVGCIWLVLFIDWLGLFLIRFISHRRWLVYYEQS